MPLTFLSLILMFTLLLISGGILLYNSQKNKIIHEKQNELAAISTLKIEEITRWRMEHIRDARIISSIVQQDKLIFQFLDNDKQLEHRDGLMERIEAFIVNYDYHSILLLDTAGVIRLAYPPATSIKTVLKDFENPEISFSDLHVSDDLPGMIHIDVQIPLYSADNLKMGTIVMRIDPYKTLFPLIHSWPTPSKSSETLIIKIEGDSLLYLNELRHRKNSALKFKLPLEEKDLPASLAVTGYEGVFEGTDYRGVPVISYLSEVPDSPWFMVAKVDKKELYSPLQERTFFISAIVFLLILSLIILIIYFWRNQHIQYLQELNETKDKFFSIVSHDLKSPFVSINGFANFLVDEVHNKDLSKVEKYAKIILDSSQNAMDLLRNLIEWSRLQTNRISFNPEEINIIFVIDEVIALMDASARQKSILISKKAQPAIKIYADREMISSVLRNIVSNSIKFSHPGGRVDISVFLKMNEIIVEVKDHGIGMKKETMDNLFRIGAPISMPGTQREHGTGLGLILVKEFISLHKGKIGVESEIGKYSKFIFTLPITLQDS